MSTPAQRVTSIRIVRAPPGEAPLPVREAWIGLELPALQGRPGRYLGSGVLSGPRDVVSSIIRLLTLRMAVHGGYAVPALQAVEILERSQPAAALWWRENTPHLVRPRRFLVFATECCEPCSSPAADGDAPPGEQR